MLTYNVQELHEDRTDQQPLEVPDGSWVLQVDAMNTTYVYEENNLNLDPESESRRNQAVGTEPRSYTLDHETWRNPGVWGWRTTSLLIGQAPFGVVTSDTYEGDGLYFTSAQQVLKGEPGRRVPITRPRIVRSASRYPQGNHDRRRKKQAGWVLLLELAKLADLPPLEMVQRYFAFTDLCGPQLHLVQGDAALIKSREWDGYSCERIRAHELTSEHWASLDLEQTWVRLGWATRVLQMRQLGYTPESVLFIPAAA